MQPKWHWLYRQGRAAGVPRVSMKGFPLNPVAKFLTDLAALLLLFQNQNIFL